MSFKMARVGDLKVGSFAVVDGEPCKVVAIDKSKPGKHGSAKFRATAISLLDNSKRSFVSPVDASIQIPIVEKKSAQIVSIGPSSVQLMDLGSYEVFDVALPEEEDVKSRLGSGKEVEYWDIMGRLKIQRVKG